MTMRFEKPSPRMVALFERLVQGRPLRRRPMFGMPCAFAGGQMCVGLFAESLFLRLSEADRDAFAAEGGRPFEPVPGRVMREYMVFPEPMLSDRRALGAWLDRSQEYAASLPPGKGRRSPAARAAGGGPAARPVRRGAAGKPAGGPARRRKR